MNDIEILYWDYGKTDIHRLGAFHRHDYWQLEIIDSGEGVLELENDSPLNIYPGDLVLVPSAVRHRFNYFEKAKESWSFKFSFLISKNNFAPMLIRKDLDAEIVRDSLKKLSLFKEDLTQSVLAARMIGVLVDKYYFKEIAEKSFSDSLEDKVRKLILQRNGGLVDVAWLAGELAYSRDYLSSLFKKKTGTALKRFIDEERLKIAKRYLFYSDYTITEISKKMVFSDQFSFSHFFKRLEGVSPSCFRENEYKKMKIMDGVTNH